MPEVCCKKSLLDPKKCKEPGSEASPLPNIGSKPWMFSLKVAEPIVQAWVMHGGGVRLIALRE